MKMNISKELNMSFGDESGRSISRRIGHGFKDVTSLNISDQTAEDIVHVGMLASTAGIFSKNPKAQIAGAIGATALFLLYHAGR